MYFIAIDNWFSNPSKSDKVSGLIKPIIIPMKPVTEANSPNNIPNLAKMFISISGHALVRQGNVQPDLKLVLWFVSKLFSLFCYLFKFMFTSLETRFSSILCIPIQHIGLILSKCTHSVSYKRSYCAVCTCKYTEWFRIKLLLD